MARPLGAMVAQDFGDVAEGLEEIKAVASVGNQEIERPRTGEAFGTVAKEADQIRGVLDHMARDDRLIAVAACDLRERFAPPNEVNRFDFAGVDTMGRILRNQLG